MSESFERLQNRILSDARVKAEDILRDAEEMARQTLEKARAEAQKEASEIVSKAQLEGKALRRGILSFRIRANRLRLLEEKNLIVQSVFRSIEERLSALAREPYFQEVLNRFVTEAIGAVGSEKPIVNIGFSEASQEHFDSVEKLVPRGAKVVASDRPIEDLGGVVASDAEGKIVFNNSFKARLDRMDNQLLAVLSSTLFGE